MRKNLFRTFSSVILVVVLLFSVASISASADYAAYVNTDGTIARTGPGTGYSVYAVLNNGSKVTVLDMNSSGWCKVRIGGNYAYIHCWNLTQESYKITPANFPAYINTNGTGFYLAPTTAIPAATTLAKGQKVTVIEEHSSGWCGVLVNSVPGFVYGSYVTPDTYRAPTSTNVSYTAYVNTTGTNIRIGPDSSFASMCTLPQGAEVTVVTELSNGWCGVYINGIPGFIYSTYLSNGQSINSLSVTLTDVNYPGYINTEGTAFRVAPSTYAVSMIALPKGTEVTVVNESSNGWLGVTINGIPGFVFGSYVTSGTNKLEPDPKTVASGYTMVNWSGYVNANNVELRAQPSSGSASIVSLTAGTPVSVVTEYTNGYLGVFVNGVPGFIYGAYVS